MHLSASLLRSKGTKIVLVRCAVGLSSLQVSFEICKQYLLSGPTFDQFQTKLEGYEVIPEILRILNISGTSQGLVLHGPPPMND